jgi:hypothetical protein
MLIGDQIHVLPTFPPQGHHVTFRRRKERDKIQHVLESPIRTAAQYHLATAAMTTYELRLGYISTC